MHRFALTAGLLIAGAAAGLPLGFALSQAAAPRLHVEVVLHREVSDIPQPARLEARHDSWDPGAQTGMHDHPGPALLAVLEGELVEETPEGRSFWRAGEVHWRAARQKHNVRNESGRPARVLAVHFDPVP